MSTQPTVARAFVVYTGLRLAAFAVLATVLLALGVPVFLGLVLALLATSIGALFLLRRQRDAFSAAVLARSDARKAERARLQAKLDQPGG